MFVFPEHALKAFTDLDYTSLHGRLLHILPGRETSGDDAEENGQLNHREEPGLRVPFIAKYIVGMMKRKMVS